MADTLAYNDPEIVYRAREKNHVGLVVRSKSCDRVRTLLDQYQERYMKDFFASMPAIDRALH